MPQTHLGARPGTQGRSLRNSWVINPTCATTDALAQVKIGLRLITRRAKKDDQVDQHRGKKVRIKLHGKDNYQLDGDMVGEATALEAEIQPGALALCVPAVHAVGA